MRASIATSVSVLLSLCSFPLTNAGGFHDLTNLLHARHASWGEDIDLLQRAAAGYDTNLPVRRSSRVEARRNRLNPNPPKLVTRAAPTTTTTAFNETLWNEQTTSACTTALADVTSVDNPTGMAMCYNIPFVDNTTGVFEADLRLYQVGEMSGAFEGLSATDISVKLSYFFATISSTVASSTVGTKRSFGLEGNEEVDDIAQRDLKLLPRETAFLQTFVYVGQIDLALLPYLPLVNTTSFRQLLIPQIDLFSNAVTPTANTTITSGTDTKTYVTGIFADATDATVTSEVASAASASAIAATATAFVLPGTTLGIFPVGLIVTGTWVLLFFTTVGLGTVGRVQFRNAYRRRITTGRQ